MASGGSNKLLTAQETADRIGYDVETLYRQWRTWKLTGYRPGGKPHSKLFFRERDVETWLESRVA